MIIWDQSNKSIYSAIFRVAIGLILLFNVIIDYLSVRGLYHQSNFNYYFPVDSLRANASVLVVLYIIVIVMFLFGIGKRISSALLFLFYLFFYWIYSQANNWGDQILLQSLLYFVLVDSFQVLSVKKSKLNHGLSQQFNNLGIWLLQFHIIFMYLINAYHKCTNPDWLKGIAIGFFLESSTVLDQFGLVEWLGKQEFLLPILNYSVLIFQVTFILVLFKIQTWFKYSILIVGVLMHLFMAVILGIWQFQIIVILHYGFFLSNQEFRFIGSKTMSNFAT